MSLERILSEQKRCADYLLAHGDDRGARLGLADWTMEEIMTVDYQEFLRTAQCACGMRRHAFWRNLRSTHLIMDLSTIPRLSSGRTQ